MNICIVEDNLPLLENLRLLLAGEPGMGVSGAYPSAEAALAAMPWHDTDILLADIDLFKRINDTWGHAAGDQILADVAARLTEVAGGAALVARWGGEEFLVLLPDADEDEGGRVGERLRAALAARPLRPAPGADPVTVSVGVAGIGAHETLSAAIDRADRAMYRSKSGGRDAVSVASAPMAVSP